MTDPISLITGNFTQWEKRDNYLSLLTEFIKNKITGAAFKEKFYEMFHDYANNHYKWEQVGLRIPEDNEEIIKQHIFTDILCDLFMDCDAFIEERDLCEEGDLSEEDLREYATKYFWKIKALM